MKLWSIVLLPVLCCSLSLGENDKGSSEAEAISQNLKITYLGTTDFSAEVLIVFKLKSQGEKSTILKLQAAENLNISPSLIGPPHKITQKRTSSEQLILEIEDPLKEGQEYKIALTYDASYSREGLRKVLLGNSCMYAAGSWDVVQKYNIFPYFDTTDSKFTISLADELLKQGWTLITNLDSLPLEKIPIKQTGFIIGNFKEICRKNDVVAYGLEKPDDPDFTCGITTAAMNSIWKNFYNEKVKKILLLLPEYVKIEGILYCSDKHLRLNVKEYSINHLQYEALSVVSDIIDMWLIKFNGLQPSDWFLNALHQYLTYFIAGEMKEMAFGNYSILEKFLVVETQSNMELEGFSFPKSLRVHNILNKTKILVGKKIDMQDKLSKLSGGLPRDAFMIRFMMSVWGKDNFIKGLKQYIKELNGQFKVNDFISELNKISDSGDFFNSWSDKPGYPVLHVTAGESGDYKLRQEQFLWHEGDTKKTWKFPVDYKTNLSKNGRDWLDKEEKTITLREAKLELVNNEWTGYYKVNYDEKKWDSIINQLKTNLSSISRLNRAQIITDIFSLARTTAKLSAKTPDYEKALELLHYIEREDDYIPLQAAENAINYLYTKFYGEPSYKKLMKKLKGIISNVWENNKVNLTNITNGYHSRLKTQLIAKWACKLGSKPCVDQSINIFKNFTHNDVPIHEDLEEIILCTAAREKDEYATIVKMLLFSNVNSAKFGIYTTALACAENTEYIIRYFDQIMKTGSKDEFAKNLPLLILEHPKNHNMTFNFIKDNKEKLHKRYGEYYIINMMATLTRAGNADVASKVKKFIEADFNKDEMKELIQMADLTVKWKEAKTESIENFISSSGESNGPITFLLFTTALISSVRHFIFHS